MINPMLILLLKQVSLRISKPATWLISTFTSFAYSVALKIGLLGFNDISATLSAAERASTNTSI